MEIQHIHHQQTSSTQQNLREYVQNHLSEDSSILISTDLQTEGQGRQGSSWKHLKKALAFSFTLPPSNTLTLTPLEIGAILANYFSPHISLKWPNDLLNQRKEKVGGIICQLYKETILVGIGLNLLIDQQEALPATPYKIGAIFDQCHLDDDFKKEVPKKIYEYILSHRLKDLEIKEQWLNKCAHLNNHVSIQDQNKKDEGIFIGLGVHGEAILEYKDEQKEILTGSLRF